jgi:hypothetical protein
MFELLISKQYSVVLKDSIQLVKKEIYILMFYMVLYFYFLLFVLCWKKKKPLNTMNSKQLNNYNITV